MLINILFTSLISMLIGALIGFNWYKIINKNKNEDKKLRKGLYKTSYQINGGETFYSTYEITELLKTSNKSKVRVDLIKSTKSEFNSKNSSQYKKLFEFVDGIWIDSNEIEWLEDTVSESREKKINEILKK